MTPEDKDLVDKLIRVIRRRNLNGLQAAREIPMCKRTFERFILGLTKISAMKRLMVEQWVNDWDKGE